MAWFNNGISTIIGQRAEKRAQRYLQQQGLTFITRNYRCKAGEIDLVMKEDEALVFVEVKYRSKNQYGNAAEFLHHTKKKKLTKAMYHYLQSFSLNPAHTLFRLDLVAIDGHQIQWFKHI